MTPTGMFLWHGRALIVGPGIDSIPHAHYAAQISFALERPVRVRAHPGDQWVETEAAIFAPNDAHQLDCGGALMAHLFVELPVRAHTLESVQVADFHREQGFEGVRAALQRAREGKLGHAEAEQAAQQWLRCALPDALAPYAYDRRIAQALAWIAAHPGEQPDGAFLASMVHLSESRFTHLFRQQTGLSLSRYLLWARLLDAVAAIAEGSSMTEAAHQVGFADLAHMSRSFRNTFGVVPSELRRMTIAFKPSGGDATTMQS